MLRELEDFDFNKFSEDTIGEFIDSNVVEILEDSDNEELYFFNTIF
ncbi:12279_t:CDS:1, partial [Cetraspora pellucida]